MSLLKKIAGTFTLKLAAAGINFFTVILISRYLGAAGKGETSLLIANITIILLYTGILGGTALIYLTPRHNIYQLLIPAYLAAVSFSAGIAALFYFWGAEPAGYCIHLGFLSLLHALFTINAMVMLGKEMVGHYNILAFLQPLLVFVALMVLFVLVPKQTINGFTYALYFSYGSICFASFYVIRQLPDQFNFRGSSGSFKNLVTYGTTAQLANIISFLNNRVSFYLLNYLVSVGAVGIYSVGVSISEGLWLVGRSIALVQYTRIANSHNVVRSQIETIQLARISLWLTVMALLVLICLPAGFYQFIFGEEFAAVRQVTLFLSPGIAAVSLGNIFIHYFSGTGKYQYNTWAAILGLIITIPAGYLLCSRYSFAGAALATSLGQLASTGFLAYYFKRQSGLPYSDLLPHTKDLKQFIKS